MHAFSKKAEQNFLKRMRDTGLNGLLEKISQVRNLQLRHGLCTGHGCLDAGADTADSLSPVKTAIRGLIKAKRRGVARAERRKVVKKKARTGGAEPAGNAYQ